MILRIIMQALGLCYLPQPKALADNTNLCLDNSQYHAQPHPVTANIIIVKTASAERHVYGSNPCGFHACEELSLLRWWHAYHF